MEIDAVTMAVTLGSALLFAVGYAVVKINGRHDIKDAIDNDNAKEERTANATKVLMLEKEVSELKNK